MKRTVGDVEQLLMKICLGMPQLERVAELFHNGPQQRLFSERAAALKYLTALGRIVTKIVHQ